MSNPDTDRSLNLLQSTNINYVYEKQEVILKRDDIDCENKDQYFYLQFSEDKNGKIQLINSTRLVHFHQDSTS